MISLCKLRFETKLSRKPCNVRSILDFHLYKRERAGERDISVENNPSLLLLRAVTDRMYGEPLVSTATGGVQGGGAQLTALGADVLRRYQSLESKAAAHIENDLQALR